MEIEKELQVPDLWSSSMNVNQIADVYKMKEMKELERDHLCIPF